MRTGVRPAVDVAHHVGQSVADVNDFGRSVAGAGFPAHPAMAAVLQTVGASGAGTDGVDNDCDGLTDCADTADCGADPACQGGSCDTYTDKTSCQNNGCTWSNQDKVCM